MDEFEPYGVIAVERFKARLFTMSIGGIHEHLSMRRTSEDLDGFLQKVIVAAQELMRTECPNRIIVAGDRNVRTEFLRLAPWALQQSVVGSTGIPEDAPPQHVLDVTQELNRSAERRHETKRVDELLRLAVSHKKVTVGLTPTLDALSAGRVWTLIYSEDLRLAGAECESCKRLFTEDVVACPVCNVSTRPLADLVSAAVTRALHSDASIEQVRGVAADRLHESGGIGAFLRY
jgi:peptide subunit release factor 1 (eRF1)